MNEIVERLIQLKKTIATMESCTGGHIVDSITSVPGASSVLKYSCVTYSNEYKIKMQVNEEIIDKYSVYSMEVAKDMSLKIATFADSNYGVGVTGKLLKKDDDNPYGKDDEVFISVYDKDDDTYYMTKVKAICDSRVENKDLVLNETVKMLKKVVR